MTNKAYEHILERLAELDNKEDLTNLLNALLTENEQKELSNRLRIFAMLQQQRPQREISEKLGVGIATVSRGAKAYRDLEIDKILPNLPKNL
ncbi:MAG: transcriptional regulator [Pseudomonadales bacterium]|nr:MAG: transcriptional regulator [Pseudomonadales bacterium]